MGELDYVAVAKAAYDATADTYARLIGTEISSATEAPLDRALLAAFVELVADHRSRLVADIGCGPGRVAAFLAARGIDVVGIDVSPEMLAVARKAHPGIDFREGRLTAVPLADGSLAGAVCWYSIIHTPPERLDVVGVELARVLAPGGQLLVAFQAGAGERVERVGVHGTGATLVNYRHSPDDVAGCMIAAGLDVRARVEREPELEHESSPQAFLLATRVE